MSKVRYVDNLYDVSLELGDETPVIETMSIKRSAFSHERGVRLIKNILSPPLFLSYVRYSKAADNELSEEIIETSKADITEYKNTSVNHVSFSEFSNDVFLKKFQFIHQQISGLLKW